MVTRFAGTTCREAVRSGAAVAGLDDDCGVDTVIDGADGLAVDLDIDVDTELQLDIDLSRAG